MINREWGQMSLRLASFARIVYSWLQRHATSSENTWFSKVMELINRVIWSRSVWCEAFAIHPKLRCTHMSLDVRVHQTTRMLSTCLEGNELANAEGEVQRCSAGQSCLYTLYRSTGSLSEIRTEHSKGGEYRGILPIILCLEEAVNR